MESIHFAEPATSAIEKEITALEDKNKEEVPVKGKQANPYIVMVIMVTLLIGGIILISNI